MEGEGRVEAGRHISEVRVDGDGGPDDHKARWENSVIPVCRVILKKQTDGPELLSSPLSLPPLSSVPRLRKKKKSTGEKPRTARRRTTWSVLSEDRMWQSEIKCDTESKLKVTFCLKTQRSDFLNLGDSVDFRLVFVWNEKKKPKQESQS